MPIIYRYVIKEILRYAAIILITVVGIYLVVDFFERIDNFMEAGLPVSRTLVYLVYKIPMIIAQILPVALLLAVLVTFGLMGKNNELIALKSSGVSFYCLLKPLAGVGIAFSLLLFMTAEIFVPVTAAKANAIWWGEVKKRAAVLSQEKNIWLKDDQKITHIKYYDRDERAAFGITVYEFDRDFRLIERIDAEKAVYHSKEGAEAEGGRPENGDQDINAALGSWNVYGLMKQALDKESGQYQVSFEQGPSRLTLGISPENLETVVKKSEEMGLLELHAYVQRIESEGYDATRYRVDLHSKIAFPFICFILGLVSAGIAGRGKIRDGLPVGIAYGIGIAFLYWIFYSFCVSIGYGGMLPPVAAAWSANFLFLCFAVITLLNVE
jgi:lipopolysaccharide export system permease protein